MGSGVFGVQNTVPALLQKSKTTVADADLFLLLQGLFKQLQ